jgi:hypothetical protein
MGRLPKRLSRTMPARLYICPDCGYRTDYRWVLKNHLYYTHNYRKRYAEWLAAGSEYFLNPQYIRRDVLLPDLEEESDEE